MNKGLTGLERHEGDGRMTELNFWVNYPFKRERPHAKQAVTV